LAGVSENEERIVEMIVKRILLCNLKDEKLDVFAHFDIEYVKENGMFSMKTDCTDGDHPPNIAYEAMKYFYHKHKYHMAGGPSNGDCLLELKKVSDDESPSESGLAKFILEKYIEKFENYRKIVWSISNPSKIPNFKAQAHGELTFAKCFNENTFSEHSKEDAEDFSDRFDYLWSMIETAMESRILSFNEINLNYQRDLTILLGLYGIAATILAVIIEKDTLWSGVLAFILVLLITQLILWIRQKTRVITNKKLGDYDTGYVHRKNSVSK